MASFVILAALVMTGGAVLTLSSTRQLSTLPLAERWRHPALKRSAVGLCVGGFGTLLIAAANQVDSVAWGGPTPVWAALAAICVFFLAATGFLVVATSRRLPADRAGHS